MQTPAITDEDAVSLIKENYNTNKIYGFVNQTSEKLTERRLAKRI